MATFYKGNALDIMKTIPTESINCIVTSPPYYGLRRYLGAQDATWPDGWFGALGCEPEPDMYTNHLCDILMECHRALRKDGTLWLNLGDSYAGSGKAGKNPEYQERHTEFGKPSTHPERFGISGNVPQGMKPQDLMGIPWMVAFELRRRGWWLRCDIVEAKRNPMPESVINRPVKAHEYIFLLSKSNHYFYDVEATREKGSCPAGTKGAKGSKERSSEDGVNSRPPEYKVYDGWRNKRDVWDMRLLGWKPKGGIGHYAVFPPELPYWCIMAGAPKKVCATCGMPYERIVERQRLVPRDDTGRTCHTKEHRLGRPTIPERGWQTVKTGEKFVPTCSCDPPDDTGVATILDPFAGTGTTGCVAELLGMNAILIDTYEGYTKDLYSQRMEFCEKWLDKFEREQQRKIPKDEAEDAYIAEAIKEWADSSVTMPD